MSRALTPWRVAWLVSRPGAQSRALVALPVTAFAAVTALLLLVLGGAHAFWRWHDAEAGFYQALTAVATALLVVPLLTLGGAAARLSARRRDDRLATLRLLGATPRTVAAITVLESTALAALGALAGVLVHLAALPAVGLLTFRGAQLGTGSLLLGLPGVAAVVAGVVLLAAVSAAVGLRRVVISPLGVRARHTPPRPWWGRLVIAGAVLAAWLVASQLLGVLGSRALVTGVVVAGFGGTLAVLNLSGPVLLTLVARRAVHRARGPVRLIAARRVLDDPRAAWRQVSGVAMTSFVAVFAGVGLAVAGTGTADPTGRLLMADIRTGVLVTLGGSFLMVACQAGVNQAADVLDRRELYVGLTRLGMARPMLEAARVRTVLTPLLQVVTVSAVTAAVVVAPLTGMAVLTGPLTVAATLACLAAGVGVVALGLRLTRPVLAAVLAD